MKVRVGAPYGGNPDDRPLPGNRAINQADPDAGTIVDILDRVPGAWERHRQGSEDARAGRTKGLEDL